MRAALLALLAACNQVYDLAPTVARDARYFDAPIDAPYRCPPVGTPPLFAPTLSQLVLDCASYTASEARGIALAMCAVDDGKIHVATGPLAGPFTRLAAVEELDHLLISQPQLAADGTMFLLYVFDINALVATVQVFRDKAGTWVRGGDLPAAAITTANPSSGPDHRIVYATTGGLDELRLDAGGDWVDAGTDHALEQIGVENLRPLWLSPDGRRLLFAVDVGKETAFLAFTERQTTSDPFGPHIRTDLPFVIDPYIADDCSRIYFSGLRSVFYAPQR